MDLKKLRADHTFLLLLPKSSSINPRLYLLINQSTHPAEELTAVIRLRTRPLLALVPACRICQCNLTKTPKSNCVCTLHTHHPMLLSFHTVTTRVRIPNCLTFFLRPIKHSAPAKPSPTASHYQSKLR